MRFLKDCQAVVHRWLHSPFSLNRGLVGVILASTLPLFVFSFVLLEQYHVSRHAAAHDNIQSFARTAALTASREIGRAKTDVEELANSGAARADNVEWFYHRAQEAVDGFDGAAWAALLDADGHVLATTGQNIDSIIATLQPTVAQVRRTRATALSNFLWGPAMDATPTKMIAVVAPVTTEGTESIRRYVVIGWNPAQLSQLLKSLELPAGWLASLTDGAGRIVARTLDADQAVGKLADPEFLRAGRAHRRGIVSTRTYDGNLDVVGAFAQVPDSSWLVFVGVDRQLFETPVARAVAIAAVVGFAVALFGWWIAVRMSRRLSGSMADLVQASRSIGEGSLPAMSDALRLTETSAVAEVLQATAARITQTGAERERALEELRTLAAVLEQRVAERTAEAEEARIVAEDANQAKSDFLARISHEIRTPLTGALATIDLLLAGELTDGQRERLLVLRRTKLSLKHLLNDILDFAKIEANRLELESMPFSPAAVLGDAVKLVEGVATDKSLVISVQADTLPARVVADPHRLRQVLTNLLTNALTHTREGSISVSARPLNGGQMLEFVVADTGTGLSEDIKKQLFEPFPQGTASSARRHGGVGLGLAICKQLVTAMGGTIEADSAPGQGARFTFTIAVLPLGAARRGDDSETNSKVAYGVAGRVLVAEDNPTNRPLIVELLERMGHLVDSVENGAQAVEAVRHNHYDVVVLDIQMPVMSGIEAAQHIRTLDDDKANVHLIALSADSATLARRTGPSLFNEYEPKPIDWLQLGQKIQRGIALRLSNEGIELPAEPELPSDDWEDLPLLDTALLERLKEKLGADRLAKLMASLPTNVTGLLQQTSQAFERGDLAGAEAGAHSLQGNATLLGLTQLAAVAQRMQRAPSQPALLVLQTSLTQSIKAVRGWSARHLIGERGAGLRLAVPPARND